MQQKALLVAGLRFTKRTFVANRDKILIQAHTHPRHCVRLRRPARRHQRRRPVHHLPERHHILLVLHALGCRRRLVLALLGHHLLHQTASLILRHWLVRLALGLLLVRDVAVGVHFAALARLQRLLHVLLQLVGGALLDLDLAGFLVAHHLDAVLGLELRLLDGRLRDAIDAPQIVDVRLVLQPMDGAQLLVVPVRGGGGGAAVLRIAGAVRFVVLRAVGAVVDDVGRAAAFGRLARFRLVLEANEVGEVVRDLLEVLLLGRMVDLVFDAVVGETKDELDPKDVRSKVWLIGHTVRNVRRPA